MSIDFQKKMDTDILLNYASNFLFKKRTIERVSETPKNWHKLIFVNKYTLKKLDDVQIKKNNNLRNLL